MIVWNNVNCILRNEFCIIKPEHFETKDVIPISAQISLLTKKKNNGFGFLEFYIRYDKSSTKYAIKSCLPICHPRKKQYCKKCKGWYLLFLANQLCSKNDKKNNYNTMRSNTMQFFERFNTQIIILWNISHKKCRDRI